MSQEMSRRQFLGLGKPALAGALAVGVGSEIFAFGEFRPRPRIDNAKKLELQKTADSLVAQNLIKIGEFAPLVVDTPEGKKRQKPVINAHALAETLLYLSYIDGGQENVGQLVGFLQDSHGLSVLEMKKEEGSGNGYARNTNMTRIYNRLFGLSLSEDLSIHINPNVLTSQSPVFAHELYHVNQISRYGEAGTAIEASVALATQLAIFTYFTTRFFKLSGLGVDLIKDIENSEESRRDFLNKILLSSAVALGVRFSGTAIGALLGVAGAQVYDDLLSPFEMQAYLQAGSSSRFGVISEQEPVKSTLENIVTFEDVK